MLAQQIVLKKHKSPLSSETVPKLMALSLQKKSQEAHFRSLHDEGNFRFLGRKVKSYLRSNNGRLMS